MMPPHSFRSLHVLGDLRRHFFRFKRCRTGLMLVLLLLFSRSRLRYGDALSLGRRLLSLQLGLLLSLLLSQLLSLGLRRMLLRLLCLLFGLGLLLGLLLLLGGVLCSGGLFGSRRHLGLSFSGRLRGGFRLGEHALLLLTVLRLDGLLGDASGLVNLFLLLVLLLHEQIGRFLGGALHLGVVLVTHRIARHEKVVHPKPARLASVGETPVLALRASDAVGLPDLLGTLRVPLPTPGHAELVQVRARDLDGHVVAHGLTLVEGYIPASLVLGIRNEQRDDETGS